MGTRTSFALVATGLAATQIISVAYSLMALMGSWIMMCCDDDLEGNEEGKELGCWVHVILTVPFIFTALTVGLSFGGLVCLRDCAYGKCCSHLSVHSSLAMLLSGQIINAVFCIPCFIAASKLKGSKAVQSLWFKRWRQVVSIPDAAVFA